MTHLILLGLIASRILATPCTVIVHANAIVSSSCPSPLIAKPITLAKATQGKVYVADLTQSVSGGVKPYSFSATSDLDGLVLSPIGLLTGTPIKSGAFNITWTVKDSAGTVIYVQ